MVGALLDVGTGKLSPQKIYEILKSCKRTEIVVSAPAHGLSLEKVFYRQKKSWRKKENGGFPCLTELSTLC